MGTNCRSHINSVVVIKFWGKVLMNRKKPSLSFANIHKKFGFLKDGEQERKGNFRQNAGFGFWVG